MNELHPDSLPSLSAKQREEVLRLAMRLQEAENTTETFLAAAEEAGVEERHLLKAIAQVGQPTKVSPVCPAGPVIFTLSTLVASCFWLAYGSNTPAVMIAMASVVVGAGFGIGSRRWPLAFAASTVGWLLFLLGFAVYNIRTYGATIQGDLGMFASVILASIGLVTVAARVSSLLWNLPGSPKVRLHRSQFNSE